MRTITLGDVTFDFEPMEDYVTTIRGVKVPNHSGWWGSPDFLISCQDSGVNMETLGDLVHWLNTPTVRRRVKEHSGFNALVRGYLNRHIQQQPHGTFSILKFHKDEPITLAVVKVPRDSEFYLLQEQEQEPQRYVFFSYVGLMESGSLKIEVVPDRAEPSGQTSIPNWWFEHRNYSFRPEFVFNSLPKERHSLFFGLELEVSTRLSTKEMQKIVTEVEPKQEPFFYFKQDSSISGQYSNKIEIVTMPCTPSYLKKNFKIFFKKLEDLCAAKGVSLGDVFDMSQQLSNGIHIHVANEAFVQSSYRDNRHKNKFLTAFNQWDKTFQDFLMKVTKRPTSIKDSTYCHVHPGMDGYTLARRLARGTNGSHDRHSSCHETGNTVEVRVFYGLPDIKHILSCIEFTQAMFHFTQYAPISSFGASFATVFTNWLSKQPGYRSIKESI